MSNVNLQSPESLSVLIAHGEVLKNRKEYAKAKEIYMKAIEKNPSDLFLIQRLVLMTYKSAEPDPVSSLKQAQLILSDLKPDESSNPETLGMSGAINKKLYELTGDEVCLEKALNFYKRGFHLAKDYYNGINLAYVYLLHAVKEENKLNAFAYFGNAMQTNKNVIALCRELISRSDFEERNDKEYVYETLAQAYLGLDENREVIKLIPTINEQSKGSFDLDIFHEQNIKLINLIAQFKKKYPDFTWK